MYRHLQARLAESVRGFLRAQYGAEVADAMGKLVIEQPPSVEFGEYALPLAFELARKLRKAPKKIAEEIVAHLSTPPGAVEGFAAFEMAGAGYINARVDRAFVAQKVAAGEVQASAPAGHVPAKRDERAPKGRSEPASGLGGLGAKLAEAMKGR